MTGVRASATKSHKQPGQWAAIIQTQTARSVERDVDRAQWTQQKNRTRAHRVIHAARLFVADHGLKTKIYGAVREINNALDIFMRIHKHNLLFTGYDFVLYKNFCSYIFRHACYKRTECVVSYPMWKQIVAIVEAAERKLEEDNE